ncbi:MAG: hypothetical protein ACP5FX_02840 [Candidatus Micrarchaeia archaeon]
MLKKVKGIKGVKPIEQTKTLRRKIYEFLNVVKRGYNETSWLLYLSTAIGILTSLFNLQLSGIAAWVFVFLFFYITGKFFIQTEKEISEENARKAKG